MGAKITTSTPYLNIKKYTIFIEFYQSISLKLLTGGKQL